jgi:hypothetical protein
LFFFFPVPHGPLSLQSEYPDGQPPLPPPQNVKLLQLGVGPQSTPDEQFGVAKAGV